VRFFPQNNCIYSYYVLFQDSAKWVAAKWVSANWVSAGPFKNPKDGESRQTTAKDAKRCRKT